MDTKLLYNSLCLDQGNVFFSEYLVLENEGRKKDAKLFLNSGGFWLIDWRKVENINRVFLSLFYFEKLSTLTKERFYKGD